LIALSFSGRLIAITETGPRCSTVTTVIFLHLSHLSGFPAKVGTHLSAPETVEKWTPTFVGATSWQMHRP
jgi:hypothetical protein